MTIISLTKPKQEHSERKKERNQNNKKTKSGHKKETILTKVTMSEGNKQILWTIELCPVTIRSIQWQIVETIYLIALSEGRGGQAVQLPVSYSFFTWPQSLTSWKKE